ncbi:MAG: hypothetical protein IJO32_07475 [Bacilli bacterium]|nr:hypothetical protein [Bacilli bacterium]
MREAVGSTFLFKLMIFFIFFFASFLAIAINYSQAFRIKNQIISILEQYEGYTKEAYDKIFETIGNSGYYRGHTCTSDEGIAPGSENGTLATVNGVCIKGTSSGPEGKYRIYKVSTYVSFEFPVLGNVFTIPVRGETKVITNPPDAGDDPTV